MMMGAKQELHGYGWWLDGTPFDLFLTLSCTVHCAL